MDEQALLASVKSVLAEKYGHSDGVLYSLNMRSVDDGRIVYKMYRVDRPGRSSWVVFAAHDHLVQGRTFRWDTSLSPRQWQEQRASVLMTLADQHYPAPRVIPSLEGKLVISEGPWHFLVTTFLAGQAGGVSLEHLTKLASTLAHLHRLSMPEGVGLSRWNRAYSLPHALSCLEQVKGDVPVSHRALYQGCQHTLETISTYLASAPYVLVHGDCWPQNSVCMGQEVVLIDWEGAGQGASILDLGSLLLTCQYDQYGGMPQAADPQRIAAVVAGYRAWPSSLELEIFQEAIGLRIAWVGAWMLSRLPQVGWSTGLEESFARIQFGLDLASHTAQIARASLTV